MMQQTGDTVEDRLASLEEEVRRLTKMNRNEFSIALPVSAAAALVIYLVVIASVPLPEEYGFWVRVGIGFAAAYAGVAVFSVAFQFVKVSLKAIVEVATCILALGNALAGVYLWAAYRTGTALPLFGLIRDDEAFGVAAVATAILLFLVDALALLLLYPLAQIARTDLEGNSGPSLTDRWDRLRR